MGGAILHSVTARERVLLAPYAMASSLSAGREHPESEHPYRGPFQRDRDRIVHSAAYRRLSSKTQVFTGELGDYHRTRLTHTLEVASVARTLGRALSLNEDLIEALALVHDLGHPPFGHAGEDTLDECLAARRRVLAQRAGAADRARAGNPLSRVSRPEPDSRSAWMARRRASSRDTSELRPLLEVQVVEAADSITYDTHDADDALELGLLSLDDLLEHAPVGGRGPASAAEGRGTRPRRAAPSRVARADRLASRRPAGSARANDWLRTKSIVREPPARRPWSLVASGELVEQKQELEDFLRARVYRHPDVLAHRDAAQTILRTMFAGYSADPALLPANFQQRVPGSGLGRTVGDYLAGMTDRFARPRVRAAFCPTPAPGLATPLGDA